MLCSVAGVVLAYGLEQNDYRKSERVLQALEAADAVIQAYIAKGIALQKTLDDLNAKVAHLERYQQAAADVSNWLFALETALPEALWLRRVSFQNEALTVYGQGWVEGDVVDFLSRIEASLPSWRFRLGEVASVPGGGQVAFILEGKRREVRQ